MWQVTIIDSVLLFLKRSILLVQQRAGKQKKIQLSHILDVYSKVLKTGRGTWGQAKLATVEFFVDAAGLLQQLSDLGQAPSPSLLADSLLFRTCGVIIFFILSV